MLYGKKYFSLFEKAPIVCCSNLGCSKHKKIKQENKKLLSNYAHTHTKQTIIMYGSKLIDLSNIKHYRAYGRRSYIG